MKSGAKTASISESLPLLTAAMHFDANASLSALEDIVEVMVEYVTDALRDMKEGQDMSRRDMMHSYVDSLEAGIGFSSHGGVN